MAAGRFQCDESAIVELSKLFEAGAETAEQPLDEEAAQLLAATNEVYAKV